MLARLAIIATRAPKPRRPLAVIAAVIVVALFLALPIHGSAQQEPSWDIFTGNALIDDLPVADGTVVEAWVRDVPVASTKTSGSQYQIYIEQPQGEFFAGQFLEFKVGGYGVDHQHGWEACTQAKAALYAYTEPQRGGNWKPSPDSGAVHAIKELQARRSELERERFRLSAELEHQVEIDIANVTNQWERAIEELRAETDQEIQQIERKFEPELRQIPIGPDREAQVSELKRQLASWINEKWEDFESQSKLKQQYLRDDITEIDRAKYFELNEVHQRIYQVQDELQERMMEIGTLFSYAPYTESPSDFVDYCPRPPQNWEEYSPGPESPSPESPSPEESSQNRGFFTNSISTDKNSLDNALDPTTLAVLGILLTLAATMVQLAKGN